MKLPPLNYPLSEKINLAFTEVFESIEKDEDGCILWPDYSCAGDPYFYVEGVTRSPGAIAYMKWVGPVSEGKQVSRSCGKKRCVNPEHQQLGNHQITTKKNLRRKFFAKTRLLKKVKKHFPRTTLTLGDLTDVSEIAQQLISNSASPAKSIFERFAIDARRTIIEITAREKWWANDYWICDLRRTIVLELNTLINIEFEWSSILPTDSRHISLLITLKTECKNKFVELNRRVIEHCFAGLVSGDKFPCPCKVWTGAKNAGGYGVMYYGDRRRTATHLARILEKGEDVPPGLQVLHWCDNPSCVETQHHFLGTDSDNSLDRKLKRRDPSGRKHWSQKKPELVVKGLNHGMAEFNLLQVVEIRRTFDAYEGTLGLIEWMAKYYTRSRCAIEGIAQRKAYLDILENEHPEIVAIPLHELTKFVKKWPAGDNHPLTKLTDLKVREIRYHNDQNKSRTGILEVLADRYGVSRSLVGMIIRRKKRTGISDNFHELDNLPPLFS